MSRKRWVWIGLAVVGAALSLLGGLLATSDYYPAVLFRCWLGLEPCPVVDTDAAQVVQNYLVREITEPAQFLIFYTREGEVVEEIVYAPDVPLRVLPSGEEDAVLIYSNYPFSQLAFPWEAWDDLPQGGLYVHRLEGGEWEHVDTSQTGRVPAGPPDIEGYKIGWDCQWFVSHATQVPVYQHMGYGLQITAAGQLSEDTRIRVDFLPCVPTWDPDNPEWEVIRIERRAPCDNLGGFGWSGKMLQVWVENELGGPLQGVEVSFTSDHGYGIAWDRQNVGGWTSRFGLVKWDTWGVPTRYMFFMEDSLKRLAWNFRTDLHNEYCRRNGGGSWRPPNKPGWYSYTVWVRRRSALSRGVGRMGDDLEKSTWNLRTDLPNEYCRAER